MMLKDENGRCFLIYDIVFDTFNLVFLFSLLSGFSTFFSKRFLGSRLSRPLFGAPQVMLPALAFRWRRRILRLGVISSRLLLGCQTFLQVQQHCCRQLKPQRHILHAPQTLDLWRTWYMTCSDRKERMMATTGTSKLCSKKQMYFCAHGAWNPSTGPSTPIKHGSWSSIKLATRSACSALAFVGFVGFHTSPFLSAASFK